jgi:hypothetical protein
MALHTLHIGINDYRGTGSDLRGCVNDARDLRDLFMFRSPASQSMVLDGEATRAALLHALRSMLKKLKPNDLGVISFSGHGTYAPDRDGDEPDGRDEALVCADLKLIYDDEFRGLLSARALGSRLFVITDSCHSGTVHRLFLGEGPRPRRVRYLPAAHIADVIDGPKVLHLRRRSRKQAALPNVIHFAGCRDFEFSYDAEFAGRPRGALTHYLLTTYRMVAVKTFGDWFKALGTFLPSVEFPQTPQCNASKAAMKWALPGK